MNYSKQTLGYARFLVHYYSNPTLKIKDLNSFDLHEFVSLLMKDDPEKTFEATGPDNPMYEKIMLPSLLKHLQNTTDKDSEIEFSKAWRLGISSYFSDDIQMLLDEECMMRKDNNYRENGLYPHKIHTNGETYWNKSL